MDEFNESKSRTIVGDRSKMPPQWIFLDFTVVGEPYTDHPPASEVKEMLTNNPKPRRPNRSRPIERG